MRKILFLLVVIGSTLFTNAVFAGRGCCSHHGWQAYCWSDWMWQCNDGTESPSCGCSNPRKEVIQSNITPTNYTTIAPTKTTSNTEKVVTQSALSTISSTQTKKNDDSDSNAVWYVLLWWASVYWYSKLKK